MAIEQDNAAERQARLEKMVADFRTAEQKRLIKRGIALWTQAEAARLMSVLPDETTSTRH